MEVNAATCIERGIVLTNALEVRFGTVIKASRFAPFRLTVYLRAWKYSRAASDQRQQREDEV